MADQTITSKRDAWVNEARPNDNNGVSNRLRLNGLSGSEKRAFIYFVLPQAILRGATISEAVLTVYLKGTGWTGGPHSITATRVTETWKERTIDWNNAPATVGSAVTAVTGGSGGDAVEIDVTSLLSSVSSGAEYFGIRLIVSSSGDKDLHSSESPTLDKRPELYLSWSKVPLPPEDLSPSGGRAVGTALPVLSWTFVDNFGDQTQAQSQVEIRRVSDNVVIYDSGMLSNALEEFDMNSPPTGAPAVPSLVAGTEYKWHVKAQDADGMTSEYSDYETMKYVAQPTLTINNPLATVEETTPPVDWTFTGQKKRELSLWEWDATDSKWDRIHKLSRETSTATDYTIPKNLIRLRNNDYRLIVRVWDSEDRQANANSPAYVQASQVFQYQRSGVPTAPTGLSISTSDAAVALSFSRTTMPDFWALYVDGELVDDRIDAPESFVSGTEYQILYWGATPGESHTYEVEAVVLDLGKYKHSAPVTDSYTHLPLGAWLVNTESDIRVFMAGREAPDAVIGESSEEFTPIGRRQPVLVMDQIRGYEGSFSGQLITWDGVSARAYRERALRLHGKKGREEVRLIFGRTNIPVVIRDLSIPDDPDQMGYFSIGFSYRQVAGFHRVSR